MKRILACILTAVMLLSLAACGGKQAAESVDLNALFESYKETLPETFVMDKDTMLNFMGIDVADCNQAIVVLCTDGMRTDEIWLLEAKDEAALARLTELAQTRVHAKADETITYNPEQYKVVEKAEILTSGLYLALLISPDVDTLKAGFESAVQ